MIALKFDADLLLEDMISEVFIPLSTQMMERYQKEILNEAVKKRGAKTRTSRENVEITPAVVRAESKIYAACTQYGWAILESFGSGPRMMDGNPDYAAYQESPLWNKLRPKDQKIIVGREEGPYTNFFGEEIKSSGKKAGKSIGGWGKGFKPTYVIQVADDHLNRALQTEPRGYFFRRADSLLEEMLAKKDLSSYLREVEI